MRGQPSWQGADTLLAAASVRPHLPLADELEELRERTASCHPCPERARRLDMHGHVSCLQMPREPCASRDVLSASERETLLTLLYRVLRHTTTSGCRKAQVLRAPRNVRADAAGSVDVRARTRR
jgi:hypothetical protein